MASSITVFSRDLTAPWTTALGHLGDSYVKARLAAEIHWPVSMVGYINAFHLMTLVPLLTALLAFLFVTRHPGERYSARWYYPLLRETHARRNCLYRRRNPHERQHLVVLVPSACGSPTNLCPLR